MNGLVSLIGAPTDVGAGQRGASMGPEALRVADIGPVLVRHGLDVVDRGNLGGPANPWQPPQDGYRHLDAVATWSRTVHDAVHANTRTQAEQLVARSPVLEHLVRSGKVKVVAAVYDLETGKIDWAGPPVVAASSSGAGQRPQN
jgi:arginase